jgi:hypothetical protein
MGFWLYPAGYGFFGWESACWLAQTLLVSDKQLRGVLLLGGFFFGWEGQVGWRQQVSSCRNPTEGFAFWWLAFMGYGGLIRLGWFAPTG